MNWELMTLEKSYCLDHIEFPTSIPPDNTVSCVWVEGIQEIRGGSWISVPILYKQDLGISEKYINSAKLQLCEYVQRRFSSAKEYIEINNNDVFGLVVMGCVTNV
jgi:hypothetical protein